MEGFMQTMRLCAINALGTQRQPTFEPLGRRVGPIVQRVLDYVMVPTSWRDSIVDLKVDMLYEAPDARFSDHALLSVEIDVDSKPPSRYRPAPRHHSAHKQFETHQEEDMFRVMTDAQFPQKRSEGLAQTIRDHALPLLCAPRYRRPPPTRTPQQALLEKQVRELRGDLQARREVRRQLRPLQAEYNRQ
eukprot:5290633-Pyramimonas_sp.AAC.1